MRLVVLLLWLVAVTLGCQSSGPPESTETPVATDYAAEFAKGKEARAWMATGNNHMFEAPDEVCRATIEELYKLGATEVRVTDADRLTEESPGETAATLTAKLPAEPAKRNALFDYEAKNTEDADTSRTREYVQIIFD